MRGNGVEVEYRSRLMWLAHEFTLSSFGMRRELPEHRHGGDPNRNRVNLLRAFVQRLLTDRIGELLAHPLDKGDHFGRGDTKTKKEATGSSSRRLLR